MDKFYSDSNTDIYCGDCAMVLKSLPAGLVDLTVTSPPYDNLRKYNGFTFDFESIARELYRVTKAGGVVVWVVGDATVDGSETGTSFKQALYFKEIGFNLHDTMIYKKANPGGARGSIYSYWQCFEYMFVFSKGKLATYHPIEDRVNKDPRTGMQGGRRNKDGEIDTGRVITTAVLGRRLNIWEYSTTVTDSAIVAHSAPFPEQLANDHIISWSNKGDLVLDPMCGSGTTGKLAKLNGRRSIGIDISEDYCAISAARYLSVEMSRD